MSRNIVPRVDKGADLGTAEKNWNRLFVDAVVLRGDDLRALLNDKIGLNMLTAKGDILVATEPGVVTTLPAGASGYVLKSNPAAPEGLMWGPSGARQELTNNITVTVGDDGDFPTINAALENIVALYYPKYISGGNCPRVTINLLPGFVMSEQVLVDSLDLSWIKITGIDGETPINRSALTVWFGFELPAFAVTNGGFLPIIGQLFNMDTSGTPTGKHGVVVVHNSRAIINSNCGIKNAGGNGIHALQGSIVEAYNANISGAGNNGIYADNACIICASHINASGAGNNGIHALRGSIVEAYNANISGAGSNGIHALQGSIVEAYNANISGAGNNGVYAFETSIVHARDANISGAGGNGVHATMGSMVNAMQITVTDIVGYSVKVEYGSIVSAYGTGGTFSQDSNILTSNGIIFK